ncbi:hypothetical protein SH139x_003836 [Planctomycetaceae bacterium SH139]
MPFTLVRGLRGAGFIHSCLAIACLSLIIGCGGDSMPPAETGHGGGGPDSHGAAGGDHAGHDHAAMGTHGGHVVVLDPGHIHAEWVHTDEEELLEVYVLDNPAAVTGVKLVAVIAGEEAQTFELTGDESTPGKFMIKSPNALTSIQMADGDSNKATLIVTTADGEMSTSLTDDHDHDDHAGHDHAEGEHGHAEDEH